MINTLIKYYLATAPSNITKEIMKPSSDQTVTRDADKGSSKASPVKNGSSSYGSGVPG